MDFFEFGIMDLFEISFFTTEMKGLCWTFALKLLDNDSYEHISSLKTLCNFEYERLS